MLKNDAMGDFHLHWESGSEDRGGYMAGGIHVYQGHQDRLTLTDAEGQAWGIISACDGFAESCAYYEPHYACFEDVDHRNGRWGVKADEGHRWTIPVKNLTVDDLFTMTSQYVVNAFRRCGFTALVWVDRLEPDIMSMTASAGELTYGWRQSFQGTYSLFRSDGLAVGSVYPHQGRWIAESTVPAEGSIWGIADIIRAFDCPVKAARWITDAAVAADDGGDCAEFLRYSPGHPSYGNGR